LGKLSFFFFFFDSKQQRSHGGDVVSLYLVRELWLPSVPALVMLALIPGKAANLCPLLATSNIAAAISLPP
jgi:hypothetical protein